MTLIDTSADLGSKRARRLPSFLAASSPIPVICGVAVVAAGFVLIAIAWSEIAAQTNVAYQMPYLASAGITGLALVMVGLLIVNLTVKRTMALERREQLERLADLLRSAPASSVDA